MTVTELHKLGVVALAGEPNEATLKNLANNAQQISDMVGWANDIIDKDKRVSTAFIKLQAQARAKYEDTRDENLALFHDALGDLLAAIFRHDEDLTPSSNDDDDSVEM